MLSNLSKLVLSGTFAADAGSVRESTAPQKSNESASQRVVLLDSSKVRVARNKDAGSSRGSGWQAGDRTNGALQGYALQCGGPAWHLAGGATGHKNQNLWLGQNDKNASHSRRSLRPSLAVWWVEWARRGDDHKSLL